MGKNKKANLVAQIKEKAQLLHNPVRSISFSCNTSSKNTVKSEEHNMSYELLIEKPEKAVLIDSRSKLEHVHAHSHPQKERDRERSLQSQSPL